VGVGFGVSVGGTGVTVGSGVLVEVAVGSGVAVSSGVGSGVTVGVGWAAPKPHARVENSSTTIAMKSRPPAVKRYVARIFDHSSFRIASPMKKGTTVHPVQALLHI
jgi:hypothetical protein